MGFVDGNAFYKRACLFLAALKQDRYPNSTSLASEAGCSRNTAQRTIAKLRAEFLLPLEYDESQKGYYLTDSEFDLPQLSVRKDELKALALMRKLAAYIDTSKSLAVGIDALWQRYSQSVPVTTKELVEWVRSLSCCTQQLERDAVSRLIEHLNFAEKKTPLSITYQPPSDPASIQLTGRVELLQLASGEVELLFLQATGDFIVLNSALIKKTEILESLQFKREKKGKDWCQTCFGFARCADLLKVEVRLGLPGARLQKLKLWSETQEDEFDGDVLIRRFRAPLNQRLISLLLGLGDSLVSVKPAKLSKELARQAKELLDGVAA